MFNFDNIGGKIKSLAKVLCWIGIVLSIIVAFSYIAATLASNKSGMAVASVVIGVIAGFLGSLFSWIASFFMYGFGQLIENSDILVRKVKKQDEERQQDRLDLASKIINDSAISDDEVVSFNCPYCNGKITMKKGEVSGNEISCAYCGSKIKL